MSEYTNRRNPPKNSELQIYTWLDATLKELMGLVREIPEYRAKGTQFSFSVVFPEPAAPNFRMRPIGVTIGGKRGPHDELTLAEARYQIGDFIDVAILPAGVDLSRINAPQMQHQQYHPGKQNRNRMRNRIGDGPPYRFYR